MVRVLALIFLAGCLVFAALSYPSGPTPGPVPELRIVCRPSSPERLDAGPKVLFWGNSLAFDHGWRVDDHVAVNCARQGMTAQAAVPQSEQLPRVAFAAVVLVFGSVEMVRNVDDTSQFATAIDAIVARVRGFYPGAEIVVLGVPHGSPDVWSYGDQVSPAEINDVLRDLNETTYLDINAVLSGISEQQQTYDGVHLTPQSYLVLEAAISDVLGK